MNFFADKWLEFRIDSKIENLQNPKPKKAEKAARALMRLAQKNPKHPEIIKIIPELAIGLRYDYLGVWSRCAHALAAIGEPATPALKEALGSKTEHVRKAALYGFKEMKNTAHLSILINALMGEKGGLRHDLCIVFGDIVKGRGENPEVLATVPKLLRLAKDARPGVRQNAAGMLGAIGDISAAPTIITLLGDERYEVRMVAATVLGQLGKKNPDSGKNLEFVKALVQKLSDENNGVRMNTRSSIRKIGITHRAELEEMRLFIRKFKRESKKRDSEYKEALGQMVGLYIRCTNMLSKKAAIFIPRTKFPAPKARRKTPNKITRAIRVSA